MNVHPITTTTVDAGAPNATTKRTPARPRKRTVVRCQANRIVPPVKDAPPKKRGSSCASNQLMMYFSPRIECATPSAAMSTAAAMSAIVTMILSVANTSTRALRNSHRHLIVATNMATVDSETLERVLSGVNALSGGTRRVELPASGVLPLSDGVVSFVHVVAGAVRGHPPLASGCTLGIDQTTKAILVTQPSAPDVLAAGGALLTRGDRSVILDAPEGATLVVGELQLTDPTSLHMVPDFVVVNDFAALEPAAAALAAQLGIAPFAAPDTQAGDPVICRMMATTVLLSVIRAWAENDCAPEGWAARTVDPFLDRVIAAIHQAPGREWTVESLASIGAMSRSVFAERFRSVIGRSPASYVTNVRMETAKGMLDAGSTVSETARELGYSSDEGFSRAFRRTMGMTPSLWRASQQTPVSA